MEGPTYVTLSAQVALQQELSVVANNVANTNTSGFKADRQLFQSYVDQLRVPGDSVSFVQDRATYIDRQAGPLQPTGSMMDVAINGDGFLAVATPQGTQYTRDGRLQVSADGTLVDSSGRPVLSPDSQPIQLPQGYSALQIKGDGSIFAVINGSAQNVGGLGTFRPQDPLTMRKSGDGLFSSAPGTMDAIQADDRNSRIIQGTLEGSTVQPIKEIANMTALTQAYQSLQSLLSDDNDREQKMIQTLGTPA